MNRLIASLSAAALAAVACGGEAAHAAAPATPVTRRVTAADLGPDRAWLRLRDDPSTTRHPGVEEIAPLAAPGRFDGSLHLGAGAGQQAQAAHYFTKAVPLATVLADPLSYASYVDGAHTTATGAGPELRLPMFCHGAFTTLSFQPQKATDGEGRAGVVPGVWQHWDAGRTAIWRTSRAIGDVDAGADAPLGDFADACAGDTSGVIGLIANAGGVGDASATLDSYVDDLAVAGTTYDFAVAGAASARVALRHDTAGTAGPPASGATAARTVTGVAAFRSPAGGPRYQGVGARLLIDDSTDPAPGDLTVTVNGIAAAVTRTAGGSLTAEAPAAVSDDLLPGRTVAVPFTIARRAAATTAKGGGAGTMKG
ncbi:hypothetical protein L1885_12265, partial [Streptomyces fuscigenes]|nr:hypothetical protein [Streptomyces fuscigenes]